MENDASLGILRASTRNFIDVDPTSIILMRRTTIKTAAGATKPGPSAALPAQKVKLIGNSESGVSKGEGGSDRSYEYTVLLEHTGDIKIGDYFSLPGGFWSVYALEPANGYEIKARARQYSATPTDG